MTECDLHCRLRRQQEAQPAPAEELEEEEEDEVGDRPCKRQTRQTDALKTTMVYPCASPKLRQPMLSWLL